MFQLPEEIKNTIKDYKRSLEEAEKDKFSSSRFKGIRVPWGIYSHRGGKSYMARIRLPGGLMSAQQLKALAYASKEFGDGMLHVTTRQDMQIHNVKIEDTIRVMEYLKEYNLSSRGGGGNSVRNIIACPFSGICKDELFDVKGYATALSEYLLKEDISFNLPRKFKVSFSGCGLDCAGVLINDLGFLAQNKSGRKGFKVFVGGGMGVSSRVGVLLEDFLPEEDLGYCAAAVRNIFYRKGDRRNKHHNRLRFLIHDDMGFPGFKKAYEEEFRLLKEKEYIVLRDIKLDEGEAGEGKIPYVDDKEYQEFTKYNVLPQKQKGFNIVKLRIPRGDIEWKKLENLAALESDFKGIQFIATQSQDLVLTWVKNKDLGKLFLRLKETLENFLYPDTLLDVIACKGALTCNLGLCNSPGLAKEIERMVKKEFVNIKLLSKLDIRINGCPNACAHHPIGKISLHGVAKRIMNRPAPFYKLFLGGRQESELTRLAEESGIIPAKNVPLFLKDFLCAIDKTMGNGDAYQFLQGEGKEIAREILKKYSYMPPYSENRDFYIDWGKEEEFSLDGLGPGECGAGVLDMIESDLTEAKITLEKAEKEDFLYKDIKRALFLCSRSLLIIKGSDPQSEEQAFSDFKKKFIDEGIILDIYSNVKDIFYKLNEKSNSFERKEAFSYAKGFMEHIASLYKSMDSGFNFPKKEEIPKAQTHSSVTILDLKGTPCPINYVKTKLFLENLDSGDILEVLLDEGEPINNVPKSLENDGHKIIKVEKVDNYWKLTLKKG